MFKGFLTCLSIFALYLTLTTSSYAASETLSAIGRDASIAKHIVTSSENKLKAAATSLSNTYKSIASLSTRAGATSNPADFDLDGDTDDVDQKFFAFCLAARRDIPICKPADLNRDKAINVSDISIFAQYYAASNGSNPLPGDFDGDMDVDQDDANFFGDCYMRRHDSVEIPQICLPADLNHDGVLNLTDVVLMTRNMKTY